MISVRLFAGLASQAPGGQNEFEVSCTSCATARSILDMQGIPESAVAFLMVNGRTAEFSSELHDGDRVAFFAPLGGG